MAGGSIVVLEIIRRKPFAAAGATLPGTHSRGTEMRIARLVPLLLVATAGLASCSLQPPVAERKPYAVESPNGTRIDEYYWLRDDTRQSKEVLDYLNAENAWRDTAMAHTGACKAELYDGTGRAAWIRTNPRCPSTTAATGTTRASSPGKDYPIYARRKGSTGRARAGHARRQPAGARPDFFNIGSSGVSPDGTVLAWTEDTVGRRQYTLKFRNLESGSDPAGCRDQRGSGFRLGRR